MERPLDQNLRDKPSSPEQSEDWEDIQPQGIRLAMARRMELSGRIPTFYLQSTIDASRLVATVEAGRRSLDDSVVYACARALRQHQELNAAWREGGIRRFRSINVGLAVATERGLLVPVIRNADRLERAELGAERERLVAAARSGSVQPSDLVDGTFTVTNVGRLGVDQGWPLINPPQVAILAVGRAGWSPVVRNGAVFAAQTVTMILGLDHRAVDGAEAAAFLTTLGSFLEAPS
jgi:pyruvate dehydrogenase E2 component (dihydrolipoamide acetyltransferase)